MKNVIKAILAIVSLLPLTVFADDWTAEQREVLAWEEACINADNAKDFVDCFHEDFEGWGLNSAVPTTKSDRRALAENGFASFDADVLLFKPLSVIVKGNIAVINYITVAKVKNNDTDEITYETERWTDVAIKDGRQWTWIADHGEALSDD